MPSSVLEFTDLSLEPSSQSRRMEGGGCRVSVLLGFVFVCLAAVVAVGVGIIVHFAGGDREVVCRCESVTSAEEVLQQCMLLASTGNADVCQRCPESTTPQQTSTGSIGSSSLLSSSVAMVTELTPTSTTSPQPVKDVRLPSSLYPEHYNIEIQTYMNWSNPENFTFKGSVKIWINCRHKTDNITIHSLNMNIVNESIKVSGQDPGDQSAPNYVSYDYDEKRQFLILKLDDHMQVNKTYVLEMIYTARISNDLVGLYYTKYQRNGTDVYLATTSFQPTDARKVFPCFDEPAMKATFNLTLVRPQNMISLSNMELIDSGQNFSDGDIIYVKDVFSQSPRMSTYLLVMAICDFDSLNRTTKNRVKFLTYSVPELINSTQFALDDGADLLDFFEEFFNISYPLPKLGMIALPDFVSGAMEHWGLVSYSERAMLYKEGETNEDSKEFVSVVVSHELAHMWFGNLVTMSWWDDLWLNEGFASFVENLGVDAVHPEWKIFDSYTVTDVYSALANDGLVSSHPLYVPVYHPDEINEIFDSISYSKGSAVIRMMNHFLGVETFKKGLNRYLNTLAYGNAFHDDLWNALKEQAETDGAAVDVKEVMDTWILQMNYPVVHVTRHPGRQGSIQVTQERYLEDRNAPELGKYESPFNYTWIIPLTFTTNESRSFNLSNQGVHWLWRNETTKSFSLNEPLGERSWVIANLQQIGYYRVNYDLENWEALFDQLQADPEVIPTVNRAQIINDAWNLAKGGFLPMNISFSSLDYLNNETSYQVWHAVRRELVYLDRMLAVSSVYGKLQIFLKCKLQQPYSYFGLNNTNATHLDLLARSIIAGQACKYGIESCLGASSRQYKDWMENPKSKHIDPNFRSTVYCNAIAEGGWEEWNFAFDQYKTTELATERITLLQGMACTRHPWILNTFMGLILKNESEIRFHERLNVITYVAGTQIGRYLAWNFYKSNFKTLQTLYGTSFFSWSGLVDSVTRSFNTEFDLQELNDFKLSQGENIPEIASAVEQALKKVAANIQWMTRYQSEIEAILNTKIQEFNC